MYRYARMVRATIVESILALLEKFQERDGLALSRILNLVVKVNKHNPIRVECYFEVREIATKRDDQHTFDR